MNAIATVNQHLTTFSEEQVETTAMHLARTYQQSKAIMEKCLDLIDQQSEVLKEEFGKVADDGLHLTSYRDSFSIRRCFEYGYRSSSQSNEELFNCMKKSAWRVMLDALGIKQVMSTKKREEFDKQLESGDLPEITEETICSIIRGLVGQAQEFAVEAAKEVFETLRPNTHHKTNDSFRVGKKVVLTWFVEQGWRGNGWRPNHYREAALNAIDSVFHLLDGKGVLKQYPGPLMQAMRDTDGNSGETEYFKFKCFKNHNLHLAFKRLDLVKELNYLAAGEKILGQDT